MKRTRWSGHRRGPYPADAKSRTQSELDVARITTVLLHLPKTGRVRVLADGLGEVRVVKRIEEFGRNSEPLRLR